VLRWTRTGKDSPFEGLRLTEGESVSKILALVGKEVILRFELLGFDQPVGAEVVCNRVDS
jgi:hypothetical protein